VTKQWCAGITALASGAWTLLISANGGKRWYERRVVPTQDILESLWCVAPGTCSAWVSRPNSTTFLISSAARLVKWHSTSPLNRDEEAYVSSNLSLYTLLDCPAQTSCIVAVGSMSVRGGVLVLQTKIARTPGAYSTGPEVRRS
jgi:hypothetical protein